MIRNIDVEADMTAQGESAPSIVVQDEDGTFYVTQMHDVPGGGMRCAMVGMSRKQAQQVREALTQLLEPVL